MNFRKHITHQTQVRKNTLHIILTCVLCILCSTPTAAQELRNYNAEKLENANREQREMQWGRDTTKHDKDENIPYGQFQWTIDEKLGTVIPAENLDTVVHNFQNWRLNDGYKGQFSHLGNSGSPRLNRLFHLRTEDDQMLFLTPYSYFLRGIDTFRFTNTLSPFTNLAYHTNADWTNGEDRIYTNFANNINKNAGIGFNIDYLYARGYYINSANSQFGGTVYGYYRGDRYEIHAWVNAHHSKTSENGGITDDRYIESPEIFSRTMASTDIPVNLSSTWNRNDGQTHHLSHRFHFGSYRDIIVPDSLKPQPPAAADLLMQLSDSIRTVLSTDSVLRAHVVDSLREQWQKLIVTPQEFIPVASIIHTLHVESMQHSHIQERDNSSYFTNHYYGSPNKLWDDANSISIRNTLGFAMNEGFRPWVKMGITFYASYIMRKFTQPYLVNGEATMLDESEDDLYVGGLINKTRGRLLHYNVDGEFCLVGSNVGNFDIKAKGDLNFAMGRRDTLTLAVNAVIENKTPSYWYRRYHNQYAWWDNDLSNTFRTRIIGEISNKRTDTRLYAGFENVTNYTYFATQNTLKDPSRTGSTMPSDYRHDVRVGQGNVQVITAGIEQNFKFGPIHWDNDVTYQLSTDKEILPLPMLNIYSNIYALFRLAKVLRVQLGADMRFFTSYYAPDYAPQINQFALQDASHPRIDIGSYPIINAYANFHLKRFRFYIMATHVNASTGHMFYAPHLPMNPMIVNFGLSWNFAN